MLSPSEQGAVSMATADSNSVGLPGCITVNTFTAKIVNRTKKTRRLYKRVNALRTTDGQTECIYWLKNMCYKATAWWQIYFINVITYLV